MNALRGSIFNSCEAFINAKECNSLLSKILSITGIKEYEFHVKVPHVAKLMGNYSTSINSEDKES